MSEQPENNQGTNPIGNIGNTQDDMSTVVQSLLETMQSRFEKVSESILKRIDEMGSRIDELDKSISDLMVHANNQNNQNSGSVSSNVNKDQKQ